MIKFLNGLLSRQFPRAPHDGTSAVHVAPLLLKAAASVPEEVYRQFQTAPGGLTELITRWLRHAVGQQTPPT
jgi:hypothetical protein